MIGPFERTLALRYLRGAEGRDERRGFLRFVVVAAIGGVAVGTGALLLALMIVRGFSREIEGKIVGFGQHVQVESYLGDPLPRGDSLAARLVGFGHVTHASPSVVDFALLQPKGAEAAQVDGVLVWGTRTADQPFVAERTEAGAFRLGAGPDGRQTVVLGARLAERLGVEVGDVVTAYSTRGLGGGQIQSRPRIKQFQVTGVFETGLADFDDQFAYVDLEAARDLFQYAPGEATRIDLTLDDRTFARDVATAITDEVGPPVFARPIEDVYRGLFAWVELQQSIVPLVISILVVVAAFNIVGALLVVVLEKSREIGTVLAMGASRAAVRRLFVVFGFFVGVIGASIGATVAIAFGWLQGEFQVIRLPADAYYLDAAPVDLHLLDVVITVAAALALCTLAAYIPARVAAQIQPVRTIQFGG